ncbi:MAG: hypothetical protein ACLQU0_12510 [Syntrophobacteraceae bacterium]
MDITSMVLLIACFVCLLIVAIYFNGHRIAGKSIFPGSGSPISMAQTLLSSIHVVTQHLLGVLIITLMCILMIKNIVTSEAGLPLLSAVAGYLLGKTFKDVEISPTHKTSGEPPPTLPHTKVT